MSNQQGPTVEQYSSKVKEKKTVCYILEILVPQNLEKGRNAYQKVVRCFSSFIFFESHHSKISL